jgi:hypothetical protein
MTYQTDEKPEGPSGGAFGRIMEGLQDALRIAKCDHSEAMPTGRMWWCAECGGTFSQKPPSAEGTEAAPTEG